MLSKEAYVRAEDAATTAPEDRTAAAFVVALIEIREAIEEGLYRLAVGQASGPKEISDSLRQNTAKQQEVSEQGLKLLEEFQGVRDGVKAMCEDFEQHKNLLAGVVSTLGEHAQLLLDLAEKKQDKAG
jgi:hypothetical protein